jgi:hypothetical protein
MHQQFVDFFSEDDWQAHKALQVRCFTTHKATSLHECGLFAPRTHSDCTPTGPASVITRIKWHLLRIAQGSWQALHGVFDICNERAHLQTQASSSQAYAILCCQQVVMALMQCMMLMLMLNRLKWMPCEKMWRPPG